MFGLKTGSVLTPHCSSSASASGSRFGRKNPLLARLHYMIESTATVLFLVLLVVIWLACGVLGVLSAGLHGTVGAATFQNDPHGDAIRSRRKGSDAALDGRTMHRHRVGIASGDLPTGRGRPQSAFGSCRPAQTRQGPYHESDRATS